MYTDLHRTISSTDASQDLKYWSNTYGVNMAMAWPQFEVGDDACRASSVFPFQAAPV